MTAYRKPRFKYQIAAGVFLAGCLNVFAATIGAIRVDVEGDSTLHGFSGHTETYELRETSTADADAMVEVMIPVHSLKTGLAARDRRMAVMFEADQYPNVVGRTSRPDLFHGVTGETLPFELTIRDVTRPLTATVMPAAQTDESSTLDLSFDVSLKDFNLTPPSVAGMIKVKDTVHVVVHIDLTDKELP